MDTLILCGLTAVVAAAAGATGWAARHAGTRWGWFVTAVMAADTAFLAASVAHAWAYGPWGPGLATRLWRML